MELRKKCFSAVFAVLFALTFVLCVLFVASEAEHHCTGDDCMVCQTVGTCMHLLDNMSPDPNVPTVYCAVCFALVLCIGTVSARAAFGSPVTLKVKLSD